MAAAVAARAAVTTAVSVAAKVMVEATGFGRGSTGEEDFSCQEKLVSVKIQMELRLFSGGRGGGGEEVY